MDRKFSWRPYIAGALLGVLAVISVYITNQQLGKPHYLGASTTFVRSSGLIEEGIAPAHVENNAYYQSKKVKVDWQFMLVIGILIGSFISAISSRTFKKECIPPIWRENFGESRGRRALFAFIGGIIAMFGARMAGGCPSGHGLSGLMQLSVSGYLAMAGFFGAGIIVATLLYRNKGE